MKSYLANRCQLVKYNDCQSNMLQVKAGFPQGFIIGPLLFLIYINDLSLHISPNCDIDLYADDSTVHSSSHDMNDINMYLQESVDKVSQWCKNNMCINPEKCMIISTTCILRNLTPLTVKINYILIENVNCQKILGV